MLRNATTSTRKLSPSTNANTIGWWSLAMRGEVELVGGLPADERLGVDAGERVRHVALAQVAHARPSPPRPWRRRSTGTVTRVTRAGATVDARARRRRRRPPAPSRRSVDGRAQLRRPLAADHDLGRRGPLRSEAVLDRLVRGARLERLRERPDARGAGLDPGVRDRERDEHRDAGGEARAGRRSATAAIARPQPGAARGGRAAARAGARCGRRGRRAPPAAASARRAPTPAPPRSRRRRSSGRSCAARGTSRPARGRRSRRRTARRGSRWRPRRRPRRRPSRPARRSSRKRETTNSE